MDKIMNSHVLNTVLPLMSINSRDAAMELGSKDTFSRPGTSSKTVMIALLTNSSYL